MIKIRNFRDSALIVSLIVTCRMNYSCTDSRQQQIQENIQREFVETYVYVTRNKHVEIDVSSQFETMKKINSDAFISIAYRWHNHALNTCQLSNSSDSQAFQSGYEKMLAEQTNATKLTKITNPKDRECVANIYFANWKEINNMFAHNYPNTP